MNSMSSLQGVVDVVQWPLVLPDPRATLAYRCLSLSVGKNLQSLESHSGIVLLLSFVCITCDGPGGEGYLLHMLFFTYPK